MDASDITKKKIARVIAAAALSGAPANAKTSLTPDQRTTIQAQYPKSQFAALNSLYPCGGISTLCSTVYAPNEYYNNTN